MAIVRNFIKIRKRKENKKNKMRRNIRSNIHQATKNQKQRKKYQMDIIQN
jgi:hypothetical protein